MDQLTIERIRSRSDKFYKSDLLSIFEEIEIPWDDSVDDILYVTPVEALNTPNHYYFGNEERISSLLDPASMSLVDKMGTRFFNVEDGNIYGLSTGGEWEIDMFGFRFIVNRELNISGLLIPKQNVTNHYLKAFSSDLDQDQKRMVRSMLFPGGHTVGGSKISYRDFLSTLPE